MKQLLVAAVACATLALAGCGESAPAQISAPTLTKSEWIKQADAICQASSDKMEQLGSSIDQDSSMEEIDTFLHDKVLPEVKAQLAAIRALKPPADDAAEIEAMLDEVDAAVAKVEKNPMAMTADATFARANRLAKAYGLKVCSEQ